MEQNQSAVPFTIDEMEQNQSEVPFAIEEMEQNRSAAPFTIEEMEQNQSAAPFTIEEMEQNQSVAPFTREEMEQNQNEVLYSIKEMEQNQSAVSTAVEEMEQSKSGVQLTSEEKERHLFVGGKMQCVEKSSNNENCKKQGKDKVSKTNFEDAAVCRKESLNSNKNSVSDMLDGLKQEPSVDVYCLEKPNAGGNDEPNEEEENKQVISGFEMESLEIKPEIIGFISEDLKQEIDSCNGTESREQSLGGNSEHSENSKREVIKCLVNIVHKCPTCSENFSSRESQEQHKCSTPYRCQICMKLWTRAQTLVT